MFRQILLVSEDVEILSVFKTEFSRYAIITTCSSLEDAYLLSDVKHDALFISFDVLYKSPFSVLHESFLHSLDCPLVVVSREDSSAFAIKSIRWGAADYIVFPFSIHQIEHILSTYFLTFVPESNELGSPEIRGFEKMIGISNQIIDLKKRLSSVAKSNHPILLLGESGTGKSFAAKLIHENSSRKASRFYSLNSAAIPDSLIETELFGTVTGAYTGAINRCGCFETSHNGTLFLDEIGEMPLTMQVKLLHAIENNVFRRIGSTKDQAVDVRYIFATNADLQKKITERLFRSDLFYRISIVPIVIPPLREHKEDINLLVQHFLKNTNFRLDVSAKRKLMDYDWPGNIRELFNCIQRSCLDITDDIIKASEIQLF